MVIPAIPVIVVWCCVAAVAALRGTSISQMWDEIVIEFKGKSLAVLGARGVGKTHLIKFLTTGSIPVEYKQTLAPEKSAGKRFQLQELDIKVKDTLDVSGDEAAYAEWKELHDQADVVFYLLRADKLIAGDAKTEFRVREDMKQIGGWLKDRGKQRPMFFIIGTHCDFDSEFAHHQAGDKIGNYVDRFRGLPVVRELVLHAGGAAQTKVILGSMKTEVDTEALVYQIFRQVTA